MTIFKSNKSNGDYKWINKPEIKSFAILVSTTGEDGLDFSAVVKSSRERMNHDE